jgi:hypothetical protein
VLRGKVKVKRETPGIENNYAENGESLKLVALGMNGQGSVPVEDSKVYLY